MSAMLDSLLDAERLADCLRHDDEDKAEDEQTETEEASDD